MARAAHSSGMQHLLYLAVELTQENLRVQKAPLTPCGAAVTLLSAPSKKQRNVQNDVHVHLQ